MSDNSDFSLLDYGNETNSADALSAALRIGTMVFSSWLRSLVSYFFYFLIRNSACKFVKYCFVLFLNGKILAFHIK